MCGPLGQQDAHDRPEKLALLRITAVFWHDET